MDSLVEIWVFRMIISYWATGFVDFFSGNLVPLFTALLPLGLVLVYKIVFQRASRHVEYLKKIPGPAGIFLFGNGLELNIPNHGTILNFKSKYWNYRYRSYGRSRAAWWLNIPWSDAGPTFLSPINTASHCIIRYLLWFTIYYVLIPENKI